MKATATTTPTAPQVSAADVARSLLGAAVFFLPLLGGAFTNK